MDFDLDISELRLKTARLELRAISMEDLADYHAFASLPGVGEAAGWPHHRELEQSRRVLKRLIEEQNVLALVHTASGRMIGTLGLHRQTWADKHPVYGSLRMKGLGCVLHPAYQKQGLMTEALQAVLKLLFRQTGAEACAVSCFAENEGSRRLVEKCGFCCVQGHDMKDRTGQTHSCRDYILLKQTLGKITVIS